LDIVYIKTFIPLYAMPRITRFSWRTKKDCSRVTKGRIRSF